FLTAQQAQFEEAYLLPPTSVQEILNRDRHYDVLNALSPDGHHFMIPIRAEFSSLELMAQKTYRLAMLELCPDVNREWRLSTSGIKGLKIYSLNQRKSWPVKLPKGIFISDMTWSPQGKKIAFLAHLKQGTQLWVADVTSGQAQPVNQAYIMATLAARPQYRRPLTAPSRLIQWTPDGSLLTLLVPEDRGAEPEAKSVPSAPIIRFTREKPTPTRTYPFLLRTPHDKELFRYYTTSQLALLRPGQPPQKIGQPAMYMSISLSPDGRYILAEKMTEPFSYIVGYNSFPRETQVMDRSGKILATIRKIPLQEAISRDRGRGVEENLPRDISWRPDGKGLSFLWREVAKKKKEGQVSRNSKRRDRVMFLSPPFDMAKVKTVVSSDKRFSQVSYSIQGHFLLARLSGKNEEGKNKQQIVAYDLTKKSPKKYVLVKDIDPEDILHLPGEIITRKTGNGLTYALLSQDRKAVYLQGPGYQEDFKPRPFIDRIEIKSGRKKRLFESSKEMFERPLVSLNNDLTKIIISRESSTVFPDSYLWKKGGSLEKLTNNKDPFPEITACHRLNFQFKRRDGLVIQGRIALPVDYKKGTKVPAVFWAYPREYKSFKEYKRAAIRFHNHNAFPHLSYRNASGIWLTQGYAVVEPDIPIIGPDNLYNNNYVAHLVDSVYAAIRRVDSLGWIDIDRLGVGGHSYGAFMTANLLAHTPFFKAGIAGDGAYNRTLTPMTFQNERRFIWEAQDTYLEMSPFFYADHVDTPLLMYHGAADNNSGTFLIQSERFLQALTGLGKKAVLYIYPFESHGPRCKETYLDLWARWLKWFDTYVKGSQSEKINLDYSRVEVAVGVGWVG
ncbi:MAG: S9 family peptidase, partial [Candidatus Aminicenantales bacterium]